MNDVPEIGITNQVKAEVLAEMIVKRETEF